MKISHFKIAGILSFVAAFTHISIIIGGADWYRFFGAGEPMAVLAEQGSLQPAAITFFIAAVLAVWGLYAWSGAGVIVRLPLLRTGLVIITLIYLIRGVLGLMAPFISQHPTVAAQSVTFWLVSSIICLALGMFYFVGIVTNWAYLSKKS